jgi:hypothetical protein
MIKEILEAPDNNPTTKEDVEDKDNLEVKPLTKEVILEMVKEEFTSDDSIPEDADSYLLPDGTFIEMFSDVEIDEKNKDYITNPSNALPHKHVDLFLKSQGVDNNINSSSRSRSLFFENLTGSIAIYSSPYGEETHIYLNKKEPTEKQYIALNETISSAISVGSKLIIGTSDKKEVSQKELQGLTKIEIVNLIKSFYKPGSIKEEQEDNIETVSKTFYYPRDKEQYTYSIEKDANSMLFMDEIREQEQVNKQIRKHFTKIVIEDGVTRIPLGEFEWFVNVREIEIPKSVRSIDNTKHISAFQDLKKLTKIVWNGNIYKSPLAFLRAFDNHNKLKEDKDNIEDKKVNLQTVSKEEVFKDILETVKEKFEEYDITSQDEYLDVMLLPDGTALLPKLIKEEEDEDDSPTFGDYDLENFDFFLNDYGIEKEFPEFTGSIHFYTSHPEDGSPFEIHLNSKKPTQKQYDAIEEFANSFIPRSRNEEDNYIFFDIYKPNSNKVLIKINNSDKLINAIKRFYSTGVLKEDINHREVYKSLTFSDNPERGPIFISREGKFANIGRFVTHAKIFDGQDYEGDDYYALHDAYDLIKANGGNKFEPFAYIDLWKIPNPAQKKAIITWMYYLIEWGMYTLQVNTSNSNETHNLTNKIPEEIYDDIVRNI